MRIDAFNKISQLYKTNQVKSQASTPGASFSDRLEISQTGKTYQIAKQYVTATPDVREDKVNEIKQKISTGTYQMSNEELANALIQKYFDELI